MSGTPQLLMAGSWQLQMSFLAPSVQIFADGTPWGRILLAGGGFLQTEVGTGNNGVNPNAGYPAGSAGQINRPPQWIGLQSSYPGPNIPGAAFEGMLTVISGGAPNVSSNAINTWVPISSGIQWVRQAALVGVSTDTFTWRLQVRRNGGGIVLGQADYTYTLQRS
jgi:hypothetical protein